MLASMRVLLPSLLLLGLLQPAAAQSEREPLRGTATLADGTPWAGATVHLLTRPIANSERIGKPDQRTATTDARGRFRASLLVGRSYVAWATEELDGGSVRISEARERVLAGQPLQLAANSERRPVRLTFEGLDVWRQQGRVSASCFSTTLPVIATTTALEGDDWRVPVLPGRIGYLELRCDGVPLLPWPRQVSLTQDGARAIRVAPPRRVLVEVLDGNGDPVADAELALVTSNRFELRGNEAHLGRTDVDGRAVVTVPMRSTRPFRWVNYGFGVRAAEHAPIANLSRVEVATDHDPDGDEPAISIQLPAGSTHRVRVHHDGTPQRGDVLVSSEPTSVGGIGRLNFHAPLRLQTTDADGHLRVLRCSDRRAMLLLATEDLPNGATRARNVHPVALAGVIGIEEAREELDIDLARLRRVTVAVTREQVPVDAARLAVVIGTGRSVACALYDVLTDRTGRVTLVLPRGQALHLVAWTDRAVAHLAEFDASDADHVQLELASVPLLRGTLAGVDGKPVAHAGLRSVVFGQTDDASHILGCAMQRVEATTAEDGSFVMPLFSGVHYLGVRRIGDNSGPRLHDGWVVGSDEPRTLQLEMPKPR